jgi:two-component system chemotaxis response regulator CheY
MMQVLVVDDSPLMRRYVARTLQMTGLEIQIHEAGNGVEAMQVASQKRPDLIITDLNMPVMGGEEFIARVSGDSTLRDTPILVLTADHCIDKPEKLMREGVVAYLTKPVTPEKLRRQMLDILALSEAAR